jgi:hypothetical protein
MCALGATGCAGLVGIQPPAALELTALSVSAGTLTPSFDPAVTSYTVELAYADTSVVVAATPSDVGAQLAISDQVSSGSMTVAPPVGNSTIAVTLTSSSHVTATYQIAVHRVDLGLAFAAPYGVRGIGAIEELAPGDVDGDGALDIAYMSLDGVGVLSGDGHGAFTAHGTTTSGMPRGLAVAQLTGDGRADLAIAGGPLKLAAGTPAGYAMPVVRAFSDTIAVTAAQLDADPHTDLAVVENGNLDIVIGDGDTMALGPAIQVATAVGEPRALAHGSFFPTGGDQLIVLDGTAPNIMLITWEGGGNFTWYPLPLPSGATPLEMVVADFDGDGHDDVAWLDPFRAQVVVQTGYPAWSPRTIQLSGFPRSLAAGDLDGDGRVDLVVIEGISAIVMHNEPTGFAVRTYAGLANGATRVRVGDVDGDRRGDLLFANATDTVTIVRSEVAP